MNEPVEFNAASFFEFIGRPGLVVVFLSVHPAHPLNRALHRRLREAHEDDVAFGTTTLIGLVLSASPALSFLRQGLLSCGVATPLDALPGYYLFYDGQMLAWDAGLPTRADVHAIVGGSLLGVLVFAFTKDLAILGRSLRVAADEATAARLTNHFRQVCENRPAEAAPPSHSRPRSEDELRRAYRILGVPPSASDREVEIAWRELRTKFHPDLAAADPEEFERRARLAVELNRARDLIRSHRARTAG